MNFSVYSFLATLFLTSTVFPTEERHNRRNAYRQKYGLQEKNLSIQVAERSRKLNNLSETAALLSINAVALAEETKKLRKHMDKQQKCYGCVIL